MSHPARSQVSTGSRPAKQRSDKGKEREYKPQSDHISSRVSNARTQEFSIHGSGAPEVTEQVTEKKQLPHKVHVNLLPEDASEDSDQEGSAKWKPRKIAYQAPYTAVPNSHFSHK
ncbi:hypothetical protein BELL_0041g00250 [Botrytis elliptica]|uniref:Uncharacterized protein n=1 Tax=Botrytis elliptica TaxID=278938 RepID=A0A4Z1JZ13_9HELO|nr:hypothetical protein BELL_0041g00250 [Botrytis elliptica]